jgi:DNA invertase Pin-like site-specific DNA recombinase
MMLERQREGVAKAKAEGKYKGRKPISDGVRKEVVRVVGEGMTKAYVARELGVSQATLYRVLSSASQDKKGKLCFLIVTRWLKFISSVNQGIILE